MHYVLHSLYDDIAVRWNYLKHYGNFGHTLAQLLTHSQTHRYIQNKKGQLSLTNPCDARETFARFM